MGEKTRRTHRRNRTGALWQNPRFIAEGLERRVLLSSAIAAFGMQQTFATGTQPRALAIADVNLDGKPDLLIANAVGNTVSVLLGNGNGTFQPQVTFAAGSGPFAIAVADVNLDGKPDLVVADSGSNSVSVLLGNGNGTFQNPLTFATGSSPRSVAIADLNGDGKPDLVATNYSSNNVSVLLGNGNGTFQSQQTYATAPQPRSIAIADVNLDAKPDLIVANHGSNSVSVLLNSGTGTFPTQTTFAVGATPFSVTTADVNLDGKPDILVANSSSNSISVLLNTGTGSFQPQQTFAAGAGPIAIASADINGDGKPDLVVANYNANTAGVLLGNGDGKFQSQKTFAVGAGPRSVVVADLNRDGRLDLLAGNSVANSASMLLGDVPPTVLSINRTNPTGPSIGNATSVTYTVTFSEPVTEVAASDFAVVTTGGASAATPVVVGGSGAVYTVTINGISGGGTLGLNVIDNGTITDAAGNPLQPGGIVFQAPQTLATGVAQSIVIIADVNGDGRPDLISNNLYSKVVDVYLGNGNGTFQSGRTFAVAQTPTALAVADLNDDGRPDLIAAGGNAVSVLLGNGNGTFQTQQSYAVGAGAASLAVADLNGDGKLDLIVSGVGLSALNAMSILLGNGNGTFQNQIAYFLDGSPVSIVAADLNGDGRTDLAVVDQLGNSLGILLGNGNGTFAAEQTLAVGTKPLAIAASDLNGDGKVDLIVANAHSDTVGVLLGNGDGTFKPQQTFPTGVFPRSLAVVDLEGDGRPDLVLANQNSNNLSILRGNGDGTFAPQQFLYGSVPESVSAGDLNGDGRTEIVAAESGGSTTVLSLFPRNRDGSFVGQTYTISATVLSINRSIPTTPVTGATSVSFAVALSGTVTGVAPWDFGALTSGDVSVGGPITVSGSGSSYAVTVNGIRGSGTLQLELVDNDTITGSGAPLGGAGIGNGSFVGQSYTILQTYPAIPSINRLSPPQGSTSASTVQFAVNFSEPVTGVAAADFAVAAGGNTIYSGPVTVNGTGASYTVTVSGVSGSGTLGLNLVDNESIRDSVGNPLQSGGAISFSEQPSISMGANPYSLAFADVNGDGKPDLIAADAVDGIINVRLGNADGTFQPAQTSAAGLNPGHIALADLNGDGHADLIALDFGNVGTLTVLMGNGNGTFQAPQTYAAGPVPVALAVADLNGDGRPDVVVLNTGNMFSFVNSVSVLLNNGDGTFHPRQAYDTGYQPGAIAVGDVNGDGIPDVIVANSGNGQKLGNTISILTGNGDGTFQLQRTIATVSLPDSVVFADVNGDGRPDLIVGSDVNGTGTVGIMLGNGNGSFAAQQTLGSGSAPASISIADLNGDGRPDLIVSGSTTAVLLGNGDGTFTTPQTFTFGNNVGNVAVLADVNGDGRPDLILVPYASSAVAVMLNTSNGNLTGQTYAIVPVADTINGTSGSDTITLKRDTDGTDIDWTLGASSGQFPVNDPSGLIINGNGGNDTITLDYTNGNPLPNTVHLNGMFTINNLQGTNPLAGTTLDINRSTVFISYSSADPIAAIQGYLTNGYNSGAWNGTASAATGVITSAAAQTNPNHTTAVGYSDSSDGQSINIVPNTIELTYTLYGDANLDHQVNSADLQILLASLNRAGSWDQADFNYDGIVNSADLQAVLFTLNTSLGSQAAPAAVYATANAGPLQAKDQKPPALNVTSIDTATPSHRSYRRAARPSHQHR